MTWAGVSRVGSRALWGRWSGTRSAGLARGFLMARGYHVGRIRSWTRWLLSAAERERMAAPDIISGGQPPLTPTSMPVFPPTATTVHALPRAPPIRIPRRARGTVWGVLDGARGEGRGQGHRNVVLTQRSRGALRTLVDAYPMCGLDVFVATGGTLYQGRCSRLYTRPPPAPLPSPSPSSHSHGKTHMHMKPETQMRATNGHQPMLLRLGLPLDDQNAVHLPQPPAFLHSQSAYFTPGHKRSHSWGAANAPPLPSWAND
ncbi:hypothetical protein C8F04DRAFT_1259752 [Mycena alexandri]|uniref:Uncharacterized protein n=1 Tax=Mycena alexandri TaxID=1745969 RepID=A0AAD6SXC2_9AGAR|nr:hypothetical protein C8F04DRAFT_1259752 [Mycena alexandri]